ncbi:MAG: hypothetical protein Q8865_02615 [Bacillota bacterium]|nr:hypothetical protein [Bacillota bacterium]
MNSIWNLFEKSGNINVYLLYKMTGENDKPVKLVGDNKICAAGQAVCQNKSGSAV